MLTGVEGPQPLLRHCGANWRAESTNTLSLDENLHFSTATAGEFLELNEAIERLKEWDSRKCTSIELRYSGGLNREEIAESLGVSLGTVKRDLAMAEEFLRSVLSAG